MAEVYRFKMTCRDRYGKEHQGTLTVELNLDKFAQFMLQRAVRTKTNTTIFQDGIGKATWEPAPWSPTLSPKPGE